MYNNSNLGWNYRLHTTTLRTDMSAAYEKSQRTSNNRKSCHHIYNELVLCCTLPSHDIVTFSRILLSHYYCHMVMMYSLWTILIVTLLLHDIFTLCVSRLLYAVLTLCHTRLIDFCGINNFVILFAHKEIHKLTWIEALVLPNVRHYSIVSTRDS